MCLNQGVVIFYLGKVTRINIHLLGDPLSAVPELFCWLIKNFIYASLLRSELPGLIGGADLPTCALMRCYSPNVPRVRCWLTKCAQVWCWFLVTLRWCGLLQVLVGNCCNVWGLSLLIVTSIWWPNWCRGLLIFEFSLLAAGLGLCSYMKSCYY